MTPALLVALPVGVALHTRPDAGSPAVALARAPLTDEGWVTFRVVEERDGWVSVQELTHDHTTGACSIPAQVVPGIELRFWVPADALLPVVGQGIDLPVDGRGALHVAAGLPVLPTASGYTATGEGWELLLPQGTVVTHSWTEEWEPGHPGDPYDLATPWAAAVGGDGRLELSAGRHTGAVLADDLRLDERCWSLTASSSAMMLTPVEGRGGIVGGVVGAASPRVPSTGQWLVPGGAAATWGDGGPAGQARYGRWPDEVVELDRRRVCLPVPGSEPGELRVCFDRRDLEWAPAAAVRGDPVTERLALGLAGEEALCQSEQVVVGRVISTQSFGGRGGASGFLMTRSTVTTELAVHGEPPATFTFVTLGGRVAGGGFVIGAAGIIPSPGERYLLFLRTPTSGPQWPDAGDPYAWVRLAPHGWLPSPQLAARAWREHCSASPRGLHASRVIATHVDPWLLVQLRTACPHD